MKVINKNKRLVVAALLAAVIAGVFWGQSRIPALNEKAQMGLRTNFGDIAFEIVLPVTLEQSLPERIIRSTVNWGATNLQGMTFGLLFAAAILTVFASLASRTFRRPSLNTLTGIFIGAPLGVCVNCATPIAFGIYSAGARLETALATLIASPTLNIFVLTMSFSLLPWEIATAKLAGVILVLATIPFLVRRFPSVVNLDLANGMASKSFAKIARMTAAPPPIGDESFVAAISHTVTMFTKSLWYLVKFALPLMILAGFLGSAAIEIVPFEYLSQDVAGVGAILFAAVVAVFLPVPIAFDVIIVMALLTSGVDIGLATALLFGLGIYSIYPAAMIARYISLRLSLAIGFAVVLIATLLGLSAQVYFEQKTVDEREAITSGIEQSGQALYEDAVAVCDLLPDRLQMACFTQHISDFENIVSDQAICATTPEHVSANVCRAALREHDVTRQAITDGSAAACYSLPDQNSQLSCAYASTLRSAQKNYDIGRCDALPNASIVDACRSSYLNASLLFNPDDSACASLEGVELETCKVNAAIYRLADTTNIDGCDTLNPPAARDHCRYTIASTMIGRHGDRSACARIDSAPLAGRCNSLSLAWEAARDESFDLCSTLPQSDLADTCRLRVANARIQRTLAETAFSSSILPSGQPPAEERISSAVAESRPSAPVVEWLALESGEGIELAYAPYFERSGPQAASFKRLNASALGISPPWRFQASDFFEPFIIGKGIASGDFNNDSWPDLVFASNRGIRVYRNIGGHFEAVAVNQGELGAANVFVVAFVDADNDGLQDIFASSYGGMNYLLLNQGGSFERATLQPLAGDHRLTLSAGFGDLNQDGQLDIVLGNWSSGIEKLFAPEESANTLMLRDGEGYRSELLVEVKGETNSVLIADISGDHISDLMIANDRLIPDIVYIGSEAGDLKKLSSESGVIPLTTMFTMSLDAADFDNDLDIDVFATDMTFARSSRDDYCAGIDDTDEEAICRKTLGVYRDFQDGSASSCEGLALAGDRQECFTAFLVKAAKDVKDSRYCDKLPKDRTAIRSLCEYLTRPAPVEAPIDQSQYFEQTQRNTLLLRSGEKFIERAQELGVDSSFWSWNAKAADLDNDGWQDIYVGNGFHFGDNFYEIQENVMYQNIEGQRFEQVQSAWNLNDPINTPSYTYADFDLDGDIDIIATGVLAPPRVFVNELAVGNSVSFALVDERGNSSAIGAEVTIHYGGELDLKQRKENKLSGGFLSFDNPIIQFGVGKQTSIDKVLVRWPDGDESIVGGPLDTMRMYRIVRTKKGRASM